MDAEVLNLLLNIGAASLVPMAGGIAAYFVQKLKMGALDLSTKKWEQTKLTINAAIMSAEQANKVGKLATGLDKKTYAMDLAKTLLAKQKIKVDEAILSQLIEANVWEIKNAPETKVAEVAKVAEVVRVAEVAQVAQVAEVAPVQVEPEVKVGDVIENAVG